MISKRQLRLKRSFDLVLGVVLFSLLFLPLVVLVLIASLETSSWGLFKQERVGQYGQLFWIYKVRTLQFNGEPAKNPSPKLGAFGGFLRQTKWDELPQLYNIIVGDMSFVGPRPDLPGFADELQGEDRVILKVKPGLTGPASLKYKDEASLLERHAHPEAYNRQVIWRDKVNINKEYLNNWSFCLDLKLILKSIIH